MNARPISLAGLKLIDRDSYEVLERLRSEREQSQGREAPEADDQQAFIADDDLPF